MRISYKWLKDYLDIDVSVQQLSEMLTDLGLEVEEIETVEAVAGGLKGFVVGEVLTCERFMVKEKQLSLTTVDIGTDQAAQIICGAANVATGQKVVVATLGTTLYKDNAPLFTIERKKTYGHFSEGMICAEDEMGIGTSHDGILVLQTDLPNGTPAIQLYPNFDNDHVFVLGITPNRSDANCYLGVAKDLYAALVVNHGYTKALQLPPHTDLSQAKSKEPYSVVVKDAQKCPRYSGVLLNNVQIAPSPKWLQERLAANGIRAINNVVDITNYILLEYGQPLHAFDADRIGGNGIVVTTLPTNTPFVDLNGKTHALHPNDLMICDANLQPMCMGGIFGGFHSGVSEQTTSIFLEAAYFDMKNIRQSSTRHQLKTDAAYRFERGTDPNNTLAALERAVYLLQEIAGAKVASAVVDNYPQPIEPVQIDLQYAHLERLIGMPFPPDLVQQILQVLDMPIVAIDSEKISVKVPTNKVDVTREADLIEEIIRVYGLNKIPIPTEIRSSIAYTEGIDEYEVQYKTANYLAALGFAEIMGLSIQNPKFYPNATDLVQLLSSINADLTVMRRSLLPTALEAVAHNQNHRFTDLQLFEFGKSYAATPAEADQMPHYSEQSHLSLTMVGNSNTESWRNGKAQSTAYHFFDLKEVVHNLLAKLNLSNYQNTLIEGDDSLSYGLQYAVGKKVLVRFGEVKKTLCQQHDIKQSVFFADFNWQNVLAVLAKQSDIRFSEINKFPAVRRDLALLVDTKVSFHDINEVAVKTLKTLLQSVNLFDVFSDESKLGKDKKSYAVSFILQDREKTLGEKDIQAAMQKLQQQLEKQLGVSVRQ
ncbi:MAG: phenylalanine--tRNA ligase subunit beta [Chitinophagales bacterium]|nr:phenylalanine--tRNA ligase subunit beta [Chitinophagales bacterium]